MTKSQDSQGPQIMVWEFRANRDYYEIGPLRERLNQLGKKWVVQLEKGNKTGYVHWQGRINLWKVKRKSELLKLMNQIGMKAPNYLAPTSGNGKATWSYLLKVDTRIDGPWKDTDQAAYVPKQYRNMTLYPYQQAIIDSKDDFDFRKVDCVIDTAGCNGKSTCASIADLFHGGIDLPWVNDAEKLIQSLCDILIAKQCRKPGIVFIDMPRCLSKERLTSLYAAIEQIKKGKVWDMRHSYKEWWFDSPRVWVFTNEAPKLKYLTADRWRCWVINEAKELVEFDLQAPIAIEGEDPFLGASLEEHPKKRSKTA